MGEQIRQIRHIHLGFKHKRPHAVRVGPVMIPHINIVAVGNMVRPRCLSVHPDRRRGCTASINTRAVIFLLLTGGTLTQVVVFQRVRCADCRELRVFVNIRI